MHLLLPGTRMLDAAMARGLGGVLGLHGSEEVPGRRERREFLDAGSTGPCHIGTHERRLGGLNCVISTTVNIESSFETIETTSTSVKTCHELDVLFKIYFIFSVLIYGEKLRNNSET